MDAPKPHGREPFRWQPASATSLAFLSGLMMTTAMPPFPGTGWLAPLALALLFHALTGAQRPARTAWVFALVHQGSLLYWLFFLDPSKSIPTRALVPAQGIAAILYVSLFYLLLGWAFRLVRDRLGRAAALCLVPLLWTGMEGLRGLGELGFPWCLSGAAWIGTPLLPLAAAAGEAGLGAATALTAAALVAAPGLLGRKGDVTAGTAAASDRWSSRGWRLALAAAAALLWCGLALGAGREAAPAGGGSAPASPGGVTLRVAAVQADVALRDKWERARIDSTRIPYADLTAAAAAGGAELVVWAETAVPAYLLYDMALLPWVRGLARENGVWLYTGYPDFSTNAAGERLKYNSSGLFAPDGTLVARYHKHHLLPIGERMPFSRWIPGLASIDVGQAEWQPGPPPAPLVVDTGRGAFPFAGLICFESIFADLSRQAVRRGARALVNITNDGWFGDTAGPRQHAALARLRAAECRVPLIRCANNGISFLCDEEGSLTARADLGRRTVVAGTVATGGGDTLFVAAGAWPLAIFLGAWSLAALLLCRRRGTG